VTEYQWSAETTQGFDVSTPFNELGNLLWTIPKGAVSDEDIKLEIVDDSFKGVNYVFEGDATWRPLCHEASYTDDWDIQLSVTEK
jgi:hypothetical protein